MIEGDVRACFDKIPHDRLVQEVARRIADTKVLTLIRRFLKSGIMIERTLVPSEEGTPQGGICSPVLANIYLHRFDDWILIIRGTKAQAQNIKEACKTFLHDEFGLERPIEKGLRRVQAKIKAMTTRSTLNDDYVYKIQAINAVIRGWATYYRAVNPTETFYKLDRYVWLRLKKWLEKKYGIGPKEVKRRYMPHQPGPKGGRGEFAAQEADGAWVWRYRATQTKLICHRPTIKKHWPHPYLEKVKVEQYVLPTMKDMWQGNSGIHRLASGVSPSTDLSSLGTAL